MLQDEGTAVLSVGFDSVEVVSGLESGASQWVVELVVDSGVSKRMGAGKIKLMSRQLASEVWL